MEAAEIFGMSNLAFNLGVKFRRANKYVTNSPQHEMLTKAAFCYTETMCRPIHILPVLIVTDHLILLLVKIQYLRGF
jgi:hypothetical protein